MIIGIDPGLKGAIAAIRINKIKGMGSWLGVKVFDMPEPDDIARYLAAWSIKEIAGSEPIVFIEKAYTLGTQGSKSNYTIAKNYGIILGILTALKIPFTEVRPQEWKKAIFGAKKTTKDDSIAMAEKLFPSIEFFTSRGRALDGRADALLIAEYGRRVSIE